MKTYLRYTIIVLSLFVPSISFAVMGPIYTNGGTTVYNAPYSHTVNGYYNIDGGNVVMNMTMIMDEGIHYVYTYTPLSNPTVNAQRFCADHGQSYVSHTVGRIGIGCGYGYGLISRYINGWIYSQGGSGTDVAICWQGYADILSTITCNIPATVPTATVTAPSNGASGQTLNFSGTGASTNHVCTSNDIMSISGGSTICTSQPSPVASVDTVTVTWYPYDSESWGCMMAPPGSVPATGHLPFTWMTYCKLTTHTLSCPVGTSGPYDGLCFPPAIVTPAALSPITAYEWHDNACTTGTLLSSTNNFTTPALTPGNHTIYLRVKDSVNTSWSSCASRTVNILPAPPTVNINFTAP